MRDVTSEPEEYPLSCLHKYNKMAAECNKL